MKNKKVVVFCSEFITSLGLIRSLGEAGYRPECYYYGTSNYLLKSRYVSKGKRFKSKNECIDFLINEYPIYEEKPILMTIPDPPTYLVDINKDILEKKFILSSAGPQGSISYWMDKTIISEHAKKHGFLIPWSKIQMKNEPISNDLKFPVFTKSIKSAIGGKKDEKVCYNINELLEVQKNVEADSFLIMQYIKKVREINYFGISIKGHVYIDYHDIRERFPIGGYGNYNKFVKCLKDDFYYRIIELIKETNYNGLFDVEFLIDKEGNKYFMEVNFRTDGTVYKLCEGINLAAEWCRLCTISEEKLPEKLKVKKDSFVGITEIDDFKDSVLSGQMNLFKWIWQFVTADRRMFFNIKDPMPMVSKISAMLARKLFCF